MELVEQQRRAIADLRELLTKFMSGDIEAAEFIPKYRRLFGPFDPPDLTTDELTDAERRELAVHIRISGGWFGEDDGLVPKRPDWEYGNDSTPYSWIDGPACRKWILGLLNEAGIALYPAP